MMNRKVCRAHIACILPLLLAALTLLNVSCGNEEKSGEFLLQEEIYGFVLGESKDAIFERAKSELSWQKMEGRRWDYRGELYYFPKPLDGTQGIEYIRLSFLDGILFEVVAYYKDTSRTKLTVLKRELEARFGGSMKAPDGTKEMAAKTYRLPGPGMSITLRRITKPDGIELYVQYIHNELHGRLIQKKLEMNPGE
jgi:hypothetical protein